MEFVYRFKQTLYVQAWMNLERGLQFFQTISFHVCEHENYSNLMI